MTTLYTPLNLEPATITLPEDGEDVIVEALNLPFRQIANRTEAALARVGAAESRLTDAEVISDHVVVDVNGDLEYVDPVERIRVITPLDVVPIGTDWSIGGHSWTCNTQNSTLYVPLRLPVGAVMKRVRISIKQGVAGEPLGAYLLRYGPYHFTLGAITPPSVDQILTGTADSSTGDKIFAFDEGTPLESNPKATILENYVYSVQVFTYSVKTIADKVYGVQVSFDDPSPAGR